MNKEIITYGDIEIENWKFHNSNAILMNNVDIDKIIVSNKVSCIKGLKKWSISYTIMHYAYTYESTCKKFWWN